MKIRERQLVADQAINEPDFGVDVRTCRVFNSRYGLDMATADGRASQSSETIVNFLPWSEYVKRPDATDRYRVMADVLGVKLISIDNLGVGDGTSTLPSTIRQVVQQGNFYPVSQMQHEALLSEKSTHELGSVSLMGYSLGANMAASFAASAPESTRVDRLMLWETIGVQRQSSASLAIKFGLEALKWQSYYSENPAWMHQPGSDPTMWSRMRAAPAGYSDYPRGLVHGTVLADLIEAREREIIDDQTEIILMSNTKSRVSSLADNGYLVENLIANGMVPRVWDQYVGESHGMIDSTMRVKSALADYR